MASASWGIGSLLTTINPTISSLSYPIGILSGGIGLTFFTRVGLSFTLPKYEKIIFWTLLAGNLIFTLLLFSDLPKVEQLKSGLTVWEVNPNLANLVLIVGITLTILNLGLFLTESLTVKNRALKIRALLISTALIFYMTGGLAQNIVRTDILLVLSDLITTLGAGVLILAIYLPRLYQQTSIKP